MKIDRGVEERVREGFAAAITQEQDRFTTAINDLTSRGDVFFRDAMVLATEIVFGTLITLHKGQRPPEDQFRYLAREAVTMEGWAALDEGQAYTFLVAVADRRPIGEEFMSLADATQYTFVLGGFLLGGFLSDGKHWNNLLDEVETWLEAMPTD